MKKHIPAVQAEQAYSNVIKFTLPGLTPDYNQEGVFNLAADIKHLNLSQVVELLMEQGISERMALEACDDMASTIFARQLGEHFAHNMERVG